MAIAIPGSSQKQILHLDGMCNECGNCAVFCPYNGRPYRDKFTLYWSKWDFDHSENAGFLPLAKDRVLVRLDGRIWETDVQKGSGDLILQMICTVMEDHPYFLKFEEES